MKRLFFFTTVVVLATAASTGLFAQNPPPNHQHYEKPTDAVKPQPGQPIAPRLQNLGVHSFAVSTTNRSAQAFMNQGLNLAYAFNHAEAARAFAEAARLQPKLAMAYWGHALVLGPNINAPMAPEDEPKAFELVQKAVSLRGSATSRERAYIDALAKRYTGKAEDRAAANLAYVTAMRALVAKYPADNDARTLLAEALMDTRPWNYWTRDGLPYEETKEVTSELQKVLATNKNHPGALHLWVHLWEATDTPERAEAEADRLLPLMPGAGHIVHMPAHIYQRVGRYEDVIKVNIQAAKADEDYITQCRAQGIYPLAYYPHNLHFIWMGATASGQGKLAIDSARRLAAAIPHEALKTVPILQGFVVVPYWAMVRFEKWDDILAEKAPHHDTPFTRGVWQYARAMAFIGKGQLDLAEQELALLKASAADKSLEGQTTFSSNTGTSILRIAPEVVAGRIAAARKDWEEATLHLDRAIRYEDSLIYQEPHDWHSPVRQDLGNVLLAAGRPAEAEVVFWEDLKKNPENGWSLTGLLAALKEQKKTEEASHVDARLRKAWKNADFRPVVTTSANEVVLKSGVRLNYVQQGAVDGPTVIMLHGYTDSSFSYSRVLPLLPASMRVIVPDQRGHGGSDRPGRYDMDLMARDVVELMDALQISSATIVGHSMGSFVARHVAATAPGRVNKLVLVGGGPSPRIKSVFQLQQDVAALRDPVDPKFAREFQTSMVSRPVPEEFMNSAIAESLKLDALTWQKVLAGLLEHQSWNATLRVPTLVIGGDKDGVFSVAEQEALAKLFVGGRARIFPGLGHSPQWEDPEAFVTELLRFLQAS